MTKPVNCLESEPTRQSVVLAGQAINLLALSQQLDIDHSYLSRCMRGDRHPSDIYARRVARALGMSRDDLLQAINQRREAIRKRQLRNSR